MKLFLRLSICLLIFGCASYPDKNNFQLADNTGDINNTYFSDLNQDYIYKASIDVYDKHFGGIFIVKKTGDQQHRVVFTTEMGNKLFDFSYNNENFIVNFILDDLNKKILINILKRDFKVLITQNLPMIESYNFNNQVIKKAHLDGKTYYYYQDSSISKIIRAKGTKEKVRFLFTEINDNIAKKIQIIHSNIKLAINLKSIH